MIKRISINLILMVIIVLLTFVPNFGYFEIFNRTVNIIYIPIIVGGLLYKESGLILSVVYGISVLIEANINPYGAVDLINQNPLISVLPNLIFGISIYYLFNYLKPYIRRTFNISLSTLGLSVLHSLLVIIAFYIGGKNYLEFENGFFKYVVTFLDVISIEAILALLIGFPLFKWLYEFVY